jgi:hypothetical protein
MLAIYFEEMLHFACFRFGSSDEKAAVTAANTERRHRALVAKITLCRSIPEQSVLKHMQACWMITKINS